MSEEYELQSSTLSESLRKSDTEYPTWIHHTRDVVGILVALAGVCFTTWSLLAKSKADRDAAATNLMIAREKGKSDSDLGRINLQIAQAQLAAHFQELNFQAQQHDKDQVRANTLADREQTNREEQRLSTIIDGLFSGSGYSEGKLDLLTPFMAGDHRYDGIIADAIVAKVLYAHSPSEIDISFRVLAKMGVGQIESLIRINKAARQQFDDALLREFWQTLATEANKVSEPEWAEPTYESMGFTPTHLLFILARRSESHVVTQFQDIANLVGAHYFAATVNKSLVNSFGTDFYPFSEKGYASYQYDEVWNRMRAIINAKGSVTPTDSRLSEENSMDLLRRSSDLLPSAFLKENANHSAPTRLKGCFLWPGQWPSGNYPTIDFETSYVDDLDFRYVNFDHRTWVSLSSRETAQRTKEFDSWTDSAKQSATPDDQFLYIFSKTYERDGILVPDQIKEHWLEIAF